MTEDDSTPHGANADGGGSPAAERTKPMQLDTAQPDAERNDTAQPDAERNDTAQPDALQTSSVSTSAVTPQASASKRAVRAAATLFFLYHLVAITVANLPKQTVFGPDVHDPFKHYLDLTYQWQIWNMFTERPLLSSIEPKDVATWAGGRQEEVGPVLPGLVPYAGELKLYAFLARVLPGSDDTRDSRAYARALCRAIAEKFGSSPATVQLVVDTMALRSPVQVQRDGKIASPQTQRGKLRKCQ